MGEIGLTAVETDSQAAPGSRELWVKEGTTLRPRRVYAGAASGDMTEITEGLTGSEEIVTGLVTAKPREETAAIERSPFMPGPPGSNDKKKIANDDERGHPIGQHTTGFRRRRRGGARTARNFADDHRRRVRDDHGHLGIGKIDAAEHARLPRHAYLGRILPGRNRRALDGQDARATLRNRKIGFVFQNYNLLAKTTALENVELPLMYNSTYSAAQRRERAEQALRNVGLGDRMLHKSNQMSGGQMQRVAIARALVNDPAVILADEATGNLDTRTSFEVLVLFQQLHAQGRTIIFVTHNPEIARYSSRNVTLRDGHIISDVRNEEILSAAEALAKLPATDD